MEKQRVYFVIDMKSFFASVECAERGLDAMTTNLVVADSSRTNKTICLAVSPALKKLGVKNRCRLFEVPHDLNVIVAPPRMRKYIEYATNIYSIYLKYIDKNDIHVYSIDECILDVTDYLKIYNIKAKAFALKLIEEINEKYHIPATCGIGTNMYLAKIALAITAKNSKDKIGWLTEEKFIKTLWHHKPLTDFWQISYGTAKRLKDIGIEDMAGVASCNEDLLYKIFGVNAELLIDHAYGKESCEMKDIKNYKSKSKSISSSQILPSAYKYDDALMVTKEMLQIGCYELAKQHYVTNLVHISIGYEEGGGCHSSININNVTNLYKYMVSYVEETFKRIVNPKKKVRRIGYAFSNLENEKYEQYNMFVDLQEVEKEKKLRDSILKIQEKFGKNRLLKAIDISPNATTIERNNMIGGHRGGDEKETN